MSVKEFNGTLMISLICICTNLTGCVSVTMPPPSATASTTMQLHQANLASSSVGKFAPAPELDPQLDKSISGLRGSTIENANGSYSQQLRDVIIAELKSAGFYDEKSQIIIEALLTDNHVDAAIGTGTARLAARFMVDSAGERIFDKELAASTQWESSFVGAVAIPEAINQYTALYKILAAKLFDDPDFKAALARQ